ncbi:MAG TPA: DUF541 domain-containing protein [Methylophaga aminisulfidivorans]|uniref:DUF541 domain-containing protein n=2 Tax=root TaxID=1 RepID=A0A7C1ZRW7_9GAMM|nr:DUF541 domain-containing protein [Methylophaga aminisulfidivorans]
MKRILALMSILTFSTLSFAEEAPEMGIINFEASAVTEIDNDELVTRLQVFEQGKNPGQLTELVNKKTALVLDAVKHFKGIHAETSSYNTQPVYDDGKISQWRVTQQLTLETADFEQMSQFIADISSLANIQSMQFQISKEKTEQAKTQLLKLTIKNFKDKATLISKEFDRSGYELMSLSIDNNFVRPMPMMERANLMSSDMRMKGAPAALEAGNNEITVTVRGSIQLSK